MRFLVLLLSTTFAAAYIPAKTHHVEIAVGNTIKKVPKPKARLARTGQKKVFDYTLYAKLLSGSPDAIKQIEFFPDFVDDTYLPRSYTKTNGPPFETQHDCWGMSTALLKVTMKDGSVKKIRKRIKTANLKDAKFRLTYKPYGVVSGRAFGAELELVTPMKPGKVRDSIKRVVAQETLVTGWNAKTMKAWKVETDNTIEAPQDMYGLEIVSPILRGEGGLDYLKKVAQELAKGGATADSSCGFHVHVDLHGVNFAALKRICQNWIKYEDAFDLLIPPERRRSGNKYCLNVRDNMRFEGMRNEEAHKCIGQQTSVKGLAKVMNAHPDNRNRYFKLNLQNLVNKDNPRTSIEFRGHAGTCDANEIESWVRLLNAFVEASIKKKHVVPFGDARSAKDMLDGLFRFVGDPELKLWYKENL